MLSHTTPKYAAVFVDFENLYYGLYNSLPDEIDSGDQVVQVVRDLRGLLLEKYGEQCIISHAYADFERIESDVQGPLYLSGVETHNVLGTEHKNAADMRLCIDALETMYTRPDIQTFVFLAGDRDYIPVIQHLKKHARTVRALAFLDNMSGDLLQNVGEEYFIDAKTLLLPEVAAKLGTKPKREPKPISQEAVKWMVAERAKTDYGTKFRTPKSLIEEDDVIAVKILLAEFGHHREVFVTPFLHRLRNDLPHLAEHERKKLITRLEDSGIVAISKREGVDRFTGEPNVYSVIIINWNHPDVQDLNPG
ncbi:MAG: NYN domain-containing protein [Fimbriimonadaceae bacterium]|nr:NYN domain-containing protein [Fimbriimonadaceae bacterium]QYK55444.1 MAG: NYN domain-containing protein [Fimbriimonadaceae bacterium]